MKVVDLLYMPDRALVLLKVVDECVPEQRKIKKLIITKPPSIFIILDIIVLVNMPAPLVSNKL